MKMKSHTAFKRHKYIKTKENWYPTVEGNVRVSWLGLSNGGWRVCVWGGDDFGLEKDFSHVERQMARQLFEKIEDNMTQEQMKALGMWNA